MEPLTDRQADALAAICVFVEANGYPPTYAEIGAALGIRADSAWKLVRRLEDKGCVIAMGGFRKIKVRSAGWRKYREMQGGM